MRNRGKPQKGGRHDRDFEGFLAEIEKNGTEVVRISRMTVKYRELIDACVYYEDSKGAWRPTKKGLCLRTKTFARQAAIESVCETLGLKPGVEGSKEVEDCQE